VVSDGPSPRPADGRRGDTNLIVSYLVGSRGPSNCYNFMKDIASHLACSSRRMASTGTTSLVSGSAFSRRVASHPSMPDMDKSISTPPTSRMFSLLMIPWMAAVYATLKPYCRSPCPSGWRRNAFSLNVVETFDQALRPFRFTKPSPNGCPFWSSPSPGVHARCQRPLSTGRRSHSVAHTETSSQRVRPARVDTASVRSRITAGPEQESIANPAFRETRREYG
jgi:hypothetical protein